jgi:hypothetical protein
MLQATIFGPFFAMILLTLAVWVYMYIRRLHFITSRNIDPQDLAVPSALAQQAPAAVATPSDNLKNLFEMPVLFYALALSFRDRPGRSDLRERGVGVRRLPDPAQHRAQHVQPRVVAIRPVHGLHFRSMVHRRSRGTRVLRANLNGGVRCCTKAAATAARWLSKSRASCKA